MKKLIAIIVVVLLLAGAAVWENITISTYLTDIRTKTYEIIEISRGQKNIQTTEIIQKVENLENIWKKYESTLCIFANHKDIRDLCLEIQRLRGNIEVNQYEDFCAGLKVIYHLTEDYKYIMGTSLQNIF